jgi:TolB-like protein
MAAHGAGEAAERRIVFRVGINLGDIIVEGDDIYGDGVNIAARLEGICDPGGVAISASAYEQVRDKLRQLRFVDRGEHSVKNIARPVRVYALDLSAHGVAPRRKPLLRKGSAFMALGIGLGIALVIAALLGGPRLLEKLRGPAEAQAATIAVLPFANQSGDAAREYFSDGVTEGIIDALGRFSAIRVIAHNAVQAFKGRNTSPEEIGRELDVRYLVRGSVREADGRLRVGVELSDAMKGTLLWSERYEGEGRELFAIQDRIVRNVVGTLAVKVTSLEQQRASAKPPGSMEAYDLVLRARASLGRVDQGANREARSLLAQALGLAPGYADAYVALAEAELQRAGFGWIEDPAEALRRSEEALRRALDFDDPGANARAHGVLGTIYSFTGRFDAALAEADRAIAINGSDAHAYALRGGVLLWMGRIEESIASSETAQRFDPRTRSDAGGFNLALAYYLAGRYRDSVAVCDTYLARSSDVFVQAVRAAALGQLGESDLARQAAGELRRNDPFFKVELFGGRLLDPAHRAKAQEGLRKAGL